MTSDALTGAPDTEPKLVRVVAACCIDGGRVLATQRGYGNDVGFDETGWWEFPGGKVAPGEDLADALRREIREELAATIDVHEPIATITHDYPAMRLELTCFAGTLTSEFHLGEHLTARWLGPADLDTVRWLPADLQLLPILRRRLLASAGT